MESFVIPMKDACIALGYDPVTQKRQAHDWLWSRGLKQIRDGFYAKDMFYELLRRESEKCISEKEANTTTSRAKSVWATKPLKLKNTARDFLASKMQENMRTEQLQT